MRARAGNDEDQRRFAGLFGNAVAHLGHRPEVFWQLKLALRAQFDLVVTLVDVRISRQLRTQLGRSGCQSGFEGVADRVAITTGVDIGGADGSHQGEATEKGKQTRDRRHG